MNHVEIKHDENRCCEQYTSNEPRRGFENLWLGTFSPSWASAASAALASATAGGFRKHDISRCNSTMNAKFTGDSTVEREHVVQQPQTLELPC